MNYLFNTYINLHKTYYDYTEWLITDKIIKINKIPIVRVNDKTFKDIRINQVSIFNYNNLLGITNTKGIYIVYIKNNRVLSYSSINITDELDIIPSTKQMKEDIIDYKIHKQLNINITSRIHNIKYNYIKNRIKSITIDELKYIYLELYNHNENNKNIILKCIYNDINNKNDKIVNKLYEILKLVSIK